MFSDLSVNIRLRLIVELKQRKSFFNTSPTVLFNFYPCKSVIQSSLLNWITTDFIVRNLLKYDISNKIAHSLDFLS